MEPCRAPVIGDCFKKGEQKSSRQRLKRKARVEKNQENKMSRKKRSYIQRKNKKSSNIKTKNYLLYLLTCSTRVTDGHDDRNNQN